MRHKNLTEFDRAVLQFCRKCAGRKALQQSDCKDESCTWYDDMKEPRTIQLSLLPKETFFSICKNWLTTYTLNRSEFWWSDMRKGLEYHVLYEAKFGRPHKNWWGSVAGVVKQLGYYRTDKNRISPYTRSDEFVWEKKITIRSAA